MYLIMDHASAPNPSQKESAIDILDHDDDQASVDDKGEKSTFLPKREGWGNVAVGNLLDDSDDGSVSIFLDSANSSVNMRQNESDEDNTGVGGGVVLEPHHGVSQQLTSLLYRDIAIPHYSIPAPYHWENPTNARNRVGSSDDDEEEAKVPAVQYREESKPFVKAHPTISRPSFVSNRRAQVQPQSLVADLPIEFGSSRQGVQDFGGRKTKMVRFQDEPYSPEQGRTVLSSHNNRNCNGGLEALPDDEYDPNSDVTQTSPENMKHAQLRKTARRIALVLCIFGLVILISTGIIIVLDLIKYRSHVEEAQSSLVLQPTPVPSGMPTNNASSTPTISWPTITFPPSGPLVVTVQVLNDGYVNLGGFIWRDEEVQHTTTLLVQDGFHGNATLSIIEFDTLSTVGPLSTIVPWLISASIQLTIADHDANVNDKEIIRLYAKLYPNAVATQPYGDINDYGSGELDFQDGWIPVEIIPNQTEIVDIDVTQFLQRLLYASRTPPDQNDNDNTDVKLMLAHDNSADKESQSASVRFFSSESASPSQRPKMTLVLQAPDFTLSPAPTPTPLPSLGPTTSLTPTSSSKPSTTPSTSPSLHPSTSMDPTYHPTNSPQPTILSYPSCSICGGLIFANHDAAIPDVENLGPISSQENVTCGILQERALDGYLSPRYCQQLQSHVPVGETCCRPNDNTAFICNLCGKTLTTTGSGSVVNPDAMVSIPVLGEVQTCRHYQERASAGMLSPFLCNIVQTYTAPACCGILV